VPLCVRCLRIALHTAATPPGCGPTRPLPIPLRFCVQRVLFNGQEMSVSWQMMVRGQVAGFGACVLMETLRATGWEHLAGRRGKGQI